MPSPAPKHTSASSAAPALQPAPALPSPQAQPPAQGLSGARSYSTTLILGILYTAAHYLEIKGSLVNVLQASCGKIEL